MLIKRLSFVFILALCAFKSINAQEQWTSLDTLHDAEIRLMGLSDAMILNYDEEQRLTSGRNFIRTLVRALRVQGSYQYSFDSLKNLSIQVSPDNRFRILSWNLLTNEELFHQYGVIQYNPEKWSEKELNENGHKLIFPLIDRSDSIRNPFDTITNNDRWWGAIYYRIIKTECKKQVFYTLLGFDGYSRNSHKKLVDVLYFKNSKPVFGAPIFDVRGKHKLCRMIWQFNRDATMTLRYEDKMQKLVYENIVPPKASQAGMYETYIPDGTYEFMTWEKCNWKRSEALLDFGK